MIVVLRPNEADIYVRIYGKLVRVDAIATSVLEANDYMSVVPNASAISVRADALVLISDRTDLGVTFRP